MSQSRKKGVRTYVGVAAGFVAAQTSVSCSPYFLGALMSQRHLAPSGAGILYAVEMSAFAAAMLLIAPWVNRLSLRSVLLAGVILMVVGQLGSAAAASALPLQLLRAVVGFGSGLVSAGSTAAGSRTRSPERIYAVATAAMTIVFAALYMALAVAGHFHGPIGMFLLLGVFSASLIPLVLVVPDMPYESIPAVLPGGAVSWQWLLPGLAALLAMLAFNYGALAVWPFTEQIGEHIGLSVDRVAILTGIGSALASVAGIFATWLGTRFGRLAPVTIGLLLQGAGSVALCHASTALGFLLTYSWYLGLWYFGYTYILGVAAAVDPPGRLAVLTGMGYPASSALGGLTAGFLVQSYSLHSIGWLAVIGCTVALLLLVPLCLFIDRRSLPTTSAPSSGGTPIHCPQRDRA